MQSPPLSLTPAVHIAPIPLDDQEAPSRPSLCETITQKVKDIAGKAFHALGEIWGKKQDAFERNPGRWYQPEDEEKTGFFSKLMPKTAQRENWHAVSHYIAEFWSCLSNAGFLYVGIAFNEPLILTAGMASIFSHAVPKNWLLTLDKLGAVTAAVGIARYYKTFATSPWLFAPASAVGAIFYADNFYFAQHTHHNFPHILWHASAACGTYLVLNEAQGQKAF